MLSNITFEVRQVKLTLDTIKKEQAKQTNAIEELMTTVKMSAGSFESHFKLVVAMSMLVIIVIAVLAFALRLCLQPMIFNVLCAVD